MKEQRQWSRIHWLAVLVLVLGSFLPGLFTCEARQSVSLVAADAVPLRGVIEGFYGTPWMQQERLDMIAFCGQQGLNAYIYAPKDDPYHRSHWREPYPKQRLTDLAALVKAARAAHVRFVFAVSPGLDLAYAGSAAQADRAAMLEKCEALYAVGVRDFAVFFDDIEQKDGAGQASFLNDIAAALRARHPDLGAILTVPTEYFRADMVDEAGQAKPYTASFAGKLSRDVIVLYTGEGVVKGDLTAAQRQAAEAVYGRPLGIWWNYPVTDYKMTNLALGPIERLPLAGVPAVFFNPMQHAQLSRLSLATGAALARDPSHYDPQAAWHAAIVQQYGGLAPAMETFAEHAQHLETNWAEIGRQDAPALRREMDDFWQSYPRGALLKLRARHLDKSLAQVEEATAALRTGLPVRSLAECQPQVDQLARIVRADRRGLALLMAQRGKTASEADRAAFLVARSEVLQHDEEARISEKTARAFLDELTEHLDLTPPAANK